MDNKINASDDKKHEVLVYLLSIAIDPDVPPVEFEKGALNNLIILNGLDFGDEDF